MEKRKKLEKGKQQPNGRQLK